MPLLWARCTANPDHLHELNRPIAMWPDMPTCPDCAAPTEHDLSVGRRSSYVDPIVLFQGPDGQVRFVGDPNGRSAGDYAKQGFTRIELRGAAEVRRFEQHMNKHEFSRAARKAENQQRMREERESVNRSELRSRMQSMSRVGRDFARHAMAKNDAKPREYAKEAGFHSDVYSNDRSNREASRDEQGRRRRD